MGQLYQKKNIPIVYLYIDGIGIPRRVRREYRARHLITAGFESVLSWWVTINKNMDWMNYFYYNQQRFILATPSALQEEEKDLAERPGADGQYDLLHHWGPNQDHLGFFP